MRLEAAADVQALLPLNATSSDPLAHAIDPGAAASSLAATALAPNSTAGTSLEAEANSSFVLAETAAAGAGASVFFQQLESSAGDTAFVVVLIAIIIGNAVLLLCLGLGTIYWALTQPLPGELGKPNEKVGTICAVIPALLDHEATIIVETVARALAVPEIDQVILTYNTRGDDVSGVLRFLEAKREEDPRRLVLLSQADSTSKATNLNRALPLVAPHELALLLDADHHVTSDALATLAASLRAAPADTVCMQGAVLVRGDTLWDDILSTLSWYFFNIIMPTFQSLSGSCMFVGAGALWRTGVLREYGFSEGLVAEDDDLSMRVIRDGLCVHACPDAEVTELAAESLVAFATQRLRHCYGFEESMNRHLCGLCAERPRALLSRLYAWYSYTLIALLFVQIGLAIAVKPQVSLLFMLLFPFGTLLLPIASVVVAVLLMMQRRGWRDWVTISLLLPLTWVYGIAQAFLTAYARIRMICGLTWRVTERKLPGADPSAPAASAKLHP